MSATPAPERFERFKTPQNLLGVLFLAVFAFNLLIMGLDWLLFSEDVASFGLLIPLTPMVGLVAGGIGTYLLQTRYGQDSKLAAGLKGLLAGILVGIPFPLAGTMAGGAILASSGLAGLRWRLLRSRFARRQPIAK